jgi:hypothetical protein
MTENTEKTSEIDTSPINIVKALFTGYLGVFLIGWSVIEFFVLGGQFYPVTWEKLVCFAVTIFGFVCMAYGTIILE